ncbi:sugar ABC transporter substrate-binding protein [Microbacterium hatanonis]
MHMTSIRKNPALRRAAFIVAATALVGGSLVACSSGSTDGAAAGSADDLEAALEQGGEITYWSWTPSAEAQVAAFEEAYPNVTVNLVNAGTNTEEYTKLQNAIKAGSGAPDVVQIEYYAFPQFALTDGLLDLSSYGFGDLEGDYTASTWNSVDFDGKIYGLPQDSGPMAMFYNKSVFDQYGLTVPTTWDEYVAAGKALTAADPSKHIAADTGDSGFATSMIWQAGGQPFQVDGTNVTIDLSDEGSQKWADTWNQLVDNDLLAETPSWTDEWFKGLGDGSIATLVTGAWMPGVLESSVADGAGDWRVAPIPTYDGTPVTAENGGGGQAVTKQSKNPALAAAFLKWLNNDDASLQIFAESGGFPSTTAQLSSDDFVNLESDYFGGQKINEVLTAAAGEVREGWSYLPFQVYANSIFADTVGQSYASQGDLNEGLSTWQEQLVEYGNSQGFTVNQ